MPLADPTIALQAGRPLLAAESAAAANPLDTISKFAGIQNALNQNALFQQTFAARQQAGQIISTAPSFEAGLEALSRSSAAPFMGEFLSQARSMQNMMVDTAGKKQGMEQSGLQFALKNLSQAYLNPGALSDSLSAGLAVTDPLARPAVTSALESLTSAMSHGLPTEPAARAAALQMRITGLLMGSGFTPEAFHELSGRSELTNIGGSVVPTVVSPAAAGPGVAVGSGGLAMTPVPRVDIAPLGAGAAPTAVQLGGVGGVPTLGAAPAAGAGAGPAGENSLVPGGALPYPARPVPGPATGISEADKKYQIQRAEDMAGYQKALDERVNVGSGIMQTVTEARQALGELRAGGGASTYSKMAQIAQAFGASNETVDKISNGGLAASQEFNKLMVNTTMGQIREQLQGIGGSRLSQMEFKSFSENNPNIDTDPRAIEKIFNFWTRLYNRDALEQQRLQGHLDAKRPIAGWPAAWQQIMRDEGIVRPSTTAAGSQGAPTIDYEVRDGKLVPVKKGP